ncbi:hypothetical protein ACWKSP_37770 [Micromonosporaceae bacterium Da 78-11]
MTGPGFSYPPPAAPGRGNRRRLLVGVVVAWIVAVVGLAVWSVRHDPATVAEQRTIEQALPELQRAAGVVFAAAGGAGRAVVLGDLEFTTDCRVTPLRRGIVAVRDVTVYGKPGAARTDLEAISAGLPPAYRAELGSGRGGTRFYLHADAGNFIGIDADAQVGAPTMTLRLSTGCRPGRVREQDRVDPAAGPVPAALGAALAVLGAPGAIARPATVDGAVEVQMVTCPGGGVAGTYTVDGVPAPADLKSALVGAADGGLIRSDPAGWAYRTGTDSVVVVPDGSRLRIAASSSC